MGSSSDDGGFDILQAIYETPDLLELVVQQCSGSKNELRLACNRLRAAVDACVIGLEWAWRERELHPGFIAGASGFFSRFMARSTFLTDFKGGKGAERMAVLAPLPSAADYRLPWAPCGRLFSLGLLHRPAKDRQALRW